MRSIKMFRLVIASLFITLSAVSIVHAEKHGGQSASDVTDRAEQLRSQAEDAGELVNAEKREKIRDKAGNKKDRHSDDDLDDDMDDKSDHEESHEGDRGISEADRAEKRDKARSKGKGAKTKGNEKSQEMRARRDERKAIMEEHKSGRKSGGSEDLDRPDDNTAKKSGRVDVDETNVEVDEKAKKPKKPWWKFWGE